MRKPLIRMFIACLLLLALPLQGWARMTMGASDGPSHGSGAHSSCHHQHVALSGQGSSQPHPAKHMVCEHLSKTSCSTCAPCCAGAAINNSVLSIAVVLVQSPVTFFPPSRFAFHLSARLDRPPRLA